jgi:uncharacterized protein (DUF2252 family)
MAGRKQSKASGRLLHLDLRNCHVGNLRTLADSDASVNIQIRGLDQTVVGNPTHNLLRFGSSLTSAARDPICAYTL